MKRCMHWFMLLAMVLLTGLAAVAAGRLAIGATRTEVFEALGRPQLASSRDKYGKEIWYYGRANVTFVNEKVVGWRNFPLSPKPEGADQRPPLSLGSTKTDVLLLHGFPPTAFLNQALITGLQPKGTETWGYGESTITFEGEVVVGWKNAGDLRIKMGEKVPGAGPIKVGASTAKDTVALMGTPELMVVYQDIDQQLWAYNETQVLLMDGQVVWFGKPEPRVATQPPPTTTPTTPNNTTPNQPNQPNAQPAQPKANLDFMEAEYFNAFRGAKAGELIKDARTLHPNNREFYQAVIDVMLRRNQELVLKGLEEYGPSYASGVQYVYESYRKFIADRRVR